jgi:hypothetical protein
MRAGLGGRLLGGLQVCDGRLEQRQFWDGSGLVDGPRLDRDVALKHEGRGNPVRDDDLAGAPRPNGW